MKIRRLHFNDFGIFRNQTLDKISGSLVVIAGPNRAGKTTFMTALRYLGFGFPRKTNGLPHFVNQYEVDADVEGDAKKLFNIRLQGYGKPVLSPINHSEHLVPAQLYNEVDGFSYRQLFTISLDELKQVPAGIDNKEIQRLQVIMLGGGWGDALRLENIRRQLGKEATDIGGKNGKIDVKLFKPHWQSLVNALEEKDEANGQMDDYYSKYDELNKLTRQTIPGYKKELSSLKLKQYQLNLLKEHMDRFDQMTALGKELSAADDGQITSSQPTVNKSYVERLQLDWEKISRDHKTLMDQFTAKAGAREEKKLQAMLIKAGQDLEAAAKKISGWQVSLGTLREERENYLNLSNGLRQALAELNTVWENKFDILDSMGVDDISEGILKEHLETYQHLLMEQRQINIDLSQLENQRQLKEKELQEMPQPSKGFDKRLWLILLGSAAASIALGFFNGLVAISIGFMGGIGAILYFMQKNAGDADAKLTVRAIMRELKECQEQVESLKIRSASLEREIESQKSYLESVRADMLQLPEGTPYKSLMDIYYRLKDAKRRYRQLLDLELRINNQENQLRSELFSAADGVRDLIQEEFNQEDVLEQAEDIFAMIEQLVDLLKLARQLDSVGEQMKQFQSEIEKIQDANKGILADNEGHQLTVLQQLNYLQVQLEKYSILKAKQDKYGEYYYGLQVALDTAQSREVLKAFNSDRHDDPWVISAFGSLRERFSSSVEVDMQLNDLNQRVRELEEKLAQMGKEQLTLDNDLSKLQSDIKLRQALNKIHEVKRTLEPLAEEYAVKRLAELMTNKLQQSLIKSTESSLLSSAGDLLKRMTKGVYQQISTPEDISTADFRLKNSQGGKGQEIEALSRATKEQLFLSIRMSRIREIEPALPVIFDDTFVNFDPAHITETITLINELAKTNQVFLLTCHPELIQMLEQQKNETPIQFWGLENGKFYGPYQEGTKASSVLA